MAKSTVHRLDDKDRANHSGQRSFGGSAAFLERQERYVPPWKPQIDINQEPAELIADAIATCAAVTIYGVDPLPDAPELTWGVLVAGTSVVLWRWASRDAAVAWVAQVGLTYK